MDFQPIRNYGFVGNLGSCALVSREGSVDWCCLPRLDSPSIFAALLDPERGGRFSIRPASGIRETKQEYLPQTNILRTTFTTDTGTMELLDWMHMGGFEFEEEERHRLPVLYRSVQCTQGTVTIAVSYRPRLDYARAKTVLTADGKGGVIAESEDDVVCLHTTCPLAVGTEEAAATVTLREDERLSFLCSYGRAERTDLPPVLRSLERTTAYWQRWLTECEGGACRVPERWREQVDRSSLVLRVLAGGRGIAAAATTSLPEILGGSHNWDYRCSWIRDTALTVRALASLRHLSDAREFVEWISELVTTGGRRPADLQVLYPLHAQQVPPEEELSGLRGYRDSRPVRIGNDAVNQRQLDLYGEILNTVFISEFLHTDAGDALSGVLRDIVEYVCDIWMEPDNGIWELRGDPQQYTYSKVMCWVAIDRGIRLAQSHKWGIETKRWEQERDAIRAAVLERGWSEKRKSFTQVFDSEVLDATALLFPLLGFLPADHPFALSTLETIQRELADGALVYRSDHHHRKEGAFAFCSFWLVDALATAGRVAEARERFEELLRMGNHLGLYAEEIDPATGDFLGNFPQAFTHVGLINSAVKLNALLPQ
ncbi:MAG: glycoside hydrolase family 15 protein [Candidatus Peribacteraceae bacterium]|nr:glycoside hydrolase family 15 protein [Candidatus Peribacteraceae bacterium]MDD5742275.1 glycoside hydrolase family 15 protein [Candidatus Peribacteraceae bacterium]